MTVTALDEPYRAARDHRAGIEWWEDHGWPPLPLPLLIAVLLVAVLTVAAVRVNYAATYQPLYFGTGAVGPATFDLFKPVSDKFAVTRWLVIAKPGETATFEYGVENNGSDPVTIYDVPTSPDDYIYVSMGWESIREHGQHHALPVVVRPHETVELLLSIRKPACDPNGADYTINHLLIHYRAFGFSHILDSPLYGNTTAPIEVCWYQR